MVDPAFVGKGWRRGVPAASHLRMRWRVRVRLRVHMRLIGALLVVLLVPGAAMAQRFESDSAWLASKGFHGRGDYALVHLDGDAIRATRERMVSGVIASLPRLESRETALGMRFVLHETDAWRTMPADTGCTMEVFLNGGRIIWGAERGSQSIDRVVRARDLDGLEVHERALSPVEPGLACGSVLLWSALERRQVDEEFTGVLRARAILLPDETPVAGIHMLLEPGGLEQTTDSGGWASFGSVVPGRYQLEARVASGESWRGEVWVRAFAISQVAIEVERSDGVQAPGR